MLICKRKEVVKNEAENFRFIIKKKLGIFSIIATVVGLLLGFTGGVEGDNKTIIAIKISAFFIIIFIIIYLLEFCYNKF